ncbi:CHAT domain-containing protein [Spirulina subsalsa FACHB-351]|uniref:CHAT domain-containing protein n=1 Tax=Spirulina subsalsa FACHB-351 TaxID=234711 RepID=A0ABT3L526_9CYAN|nr:CHAT domain-containing protein [Spirulina subsalsa]MCW6036605.1 CHAT domain-containing protein [Spirulina subsalsa FACHB-351]
MASYSVPLFCFLFILPLITAYLSLNPAQGQITPANDSTGTIITPNGQQINITGGTLSGDGTNLFHSFEQFGLHSNQIANFLSNPQIQNILGRVTGNNPSLINGLIQVSGGNSNLYLMNPAGIIFGQNAQLNVPGDFFATTATAIGFNGHWFNASGNNDYSQLLGNPSEFAFDLSQAAPIVNTGHLAVTAGQNLTLIGGTIVNIGTLEAPAGNITVSAVPGSSLVRIEQTGHLLNLEIEPPRDTNGQILPFTAQDLPALLTGTAAETGLIVDAQGIIQEQTTGIVIPDDAQTAIVSGSLDVSNSSPTLQDGKGGAITIVGNQVGLLDASLDASGVNGGGTVRIGGDYQGGGAIPNASQTLITENSSIDASATATGDGGQVIVWSDELTRFSGEIKARGGEWGGDGGFVEVSGKELLLFLGDVDAGATLGNSGTLLLDPKNITISDATAPLVTLFNPNPVNGGYFGWSVAALGSDLLVGAPRNTSGGINKAGQAYLFNSSGELLQTFDNPNPVDGGDFGSVAVAGSEILFGASYNTSGGINKAGQAYLFNSSGQLLQTFDNPNPVDGGDFGDSVEVVGNDLLIGAPYNTYGGINRVGQAYLFNSSGELLQTLNNPNPVGDGIFGDSVTAVGNDLLIGASGNTSGGFNKAGQAYLFNSSGQLLQTFDNPNPFKGGYFGFSGAAVGSDLLIGAPWNTSGGIDKAGQVYLFNSSGQLLQTFDNPNPIGDGIFGYSVAAVGSDILIGAPYNTYGGINRAGQAYLFNSSGQLLQTFNNPNPSLDTRFGTSVAVVRDDLLIGVPRNTFGGVDYVGQAYVFQPTFGNFSDNLFNNIPSDSITLQTNTITQITNTGTHVILQANNDITINSAIVTNNPTGNGGNLTLQAGRSILINADITTDNGTLNLITNETTANGAISAFRDPGNAVITMTSGVTLNTGTGNLNILLNTGEGLTHNNSGEITLSNLTSSGTIQVENNGPDHGGIVINNTINATNGGQVNLIADGDITTRNILTANGTGTGGEIFLHSRQGAITTQALNTNGGAGDGGAVTLIAAEGITATNISTLSLQRQGGNVNLTTPGLIRITDSFTVAGLEASIATVGNTAGGTITIRHGGQGVIPFVVGDASVNGTASTLITGLAPHESIQPWQEYLHTYSQGAMQIISVDPPKVPLQTATGVAISIPDIPNLKDILVQITANQVGAIAKPRLDGSQILQFPDDPKPLIIEPFDIPILSQVSESSVLSVASNSMTSSLEDLRSDLQKTFTQDNLPLIVTQIENLFTAEYTQKFGEIPDTESSEISASQNEDEAVENIRLTLKNIREQTGTNPVMIYVMSFPEQLELVMVTPEENLIHKTLPEASAENLQKTIQTFSRIVSSRRKTLGYLPSAQKLYSWLIEPLESELEALNIDTLVLSLDRGLRTIPFAALHDGEQFIIEKYSLGQVPSISLTNTRYQSLKGSEVLAMGMSEFKNQSPLPAVSVEVQTIANTIWQGDGFLNESVTFEHLKELSHKQVYDIVHLATHATFEPGDSSNSYIQLWDRLLQINDLRQLGWYKSPQVELLVLSACQTAVGDANVELGFAGLSIQAGVKSSLASLWSVSDVGTLALMNGFYQHLGEQDVTTKAEALRRAQLAMVRGDARLDGGQLVMNGQRFDLPPELAQLDNLDLRHPYYWSGFMMVGSPW